jgi:hypothetical protein
MLIREHKDRLIKLSVIELLPRLAQFCSDMFARVYLQDCLSYLMAATKVSELRAQAFLSLGRSSCRINFDNCTVRGLISPGPQGAWLWRWGTTCGPNGRL